MSIDTRVQQRVLPSWMGFVGSTVVTLSLVVVNVLHQASQRWGPNDEPYTYYEYWLLPSIGLVLLFMVLAVVACFVPQWRRFAVGLVSGALTGAFLSFIVTAQYASSHSGGEYMIRRAFRSMFNADVMLSGLL